MAAFQTQARPNPDHFGGARVKPKRRTFTLRAGGYSVLECVLEQPETHIPVDLTTYGFEANEESEPVDQPAPQILVKFAEHIGSETTEANATILDAEHGKVSVIVPDAICTRPGIWLADFIIVDDEGREVFANAAYLYVERSASQPSCGNMPSIPEVRLYLRDYASENELLDVVDFDASEIAFAISMCVDEWNEAPPLEGPRYTTQNFPYRRHWLVGVSAYLFQIAAEHYARNSLPYAAGGLQFDDKGRAGPYMQKAQLAKQEWQAFVARQKVLLSIGGGYVEIPGILGGI